MGLCNLIENNTIQIGLQARRQTFLVLFCQCGAVDDLQPVLSTGQTLRMSAPRCRVSEEILL